MAGTPGPPPDFFASDDESDVGDESPTEAALSEPDMAGPSIPSSQNSNEVAATDYPLFLPDEEDADYGDVLVERLRAASVHPDAVPADDVDMSDIFGIPHQSGSKRAARYQPEEDIQPNKRRKPSLPPDSGFTSAFLGSIVVANAWSTVKGKGYIKNGDPVLVEWDKLKQEEELPRKSDKKKLPKKGGKQLTITALMKPRQENFKRKKKQNDIVRLTNRGGFGEPKQLVVSHRC
jgi:DNA repair protein RAD5